MKSKEIIIESDWLDEKENSFLHAGCCGLGTCSRLHRCRCLRSSCSPDLIAPSVPPRKLRSCSHSSLLSPVCRARLRRLRPGDQAGSVAAGAGQAVARHLLQVPSVRLRSDRRVHQQVGQADPDIAPLQLLRSYSKVRRRCVCVSSRRQGWNSVL